MPRNPQHTSTKTATSGLARVLYGGQYLDGKTSRWISADPAMGEYIPQAPVNDDAKKRNKNLPGMGGIYNTVNMHVYHYAGNNPIKLVDPDGKFPKPGIDGETPIVVLEEIAKLSEQIKNVAALLGVDPVGIASVIFQEKYYWGFALLKNAGAYIHDRGVDDSTLSTRTYGLAEMQLGLAAELLGEDINTPDTKKRMFDLLQNDNWSITLIGLYIKKNESELGMKLKGAAAAAAHTMGASGYRSYLEGKRGLKELAERSIDYQMAIQDALNGTIDYRKDSER